MATDYGVLKDVVTVAGSLIAATYAIGLAWMRRAKWMPPNETVTGGTAKTSALLCAVIVVVLYLLRTQIGFANLAYFALGLLPGVLLGLSVSIYVNTAYSYTKRAVTPHGQNIEERVLGGFSLTEEAKKISAKKGKLAQALYENSNYQRDLVWTQGSQAALQVASTLGFIVLQVCGSLALATASMLVGISGGNPT
jgi:hypothetical protein